MHVTVRHFEIPVRDPDRAARFYREAFGWLVEPLDWPGYPYCTVRMPEPSEADPPRGGGGGIPGGLASRDDLETGHPLLVLHVGEGSLEDCLAAVTAAGGAIERKPKPVGGMGRFARIRDTEGNLLGVWKPRSPLL